MLDNLIQSVILETQLENKRKEGKKKRGFQIS